MCRLQEDLALRKDAADSADATASIASGKPGAHAPERTVRTQKGDARHETLLPAPSVGLRNRCWGDQSG